MIGIADLEDHADREEQFDEIQSEWACLPNLEMILSLLSMLLKEKRND